MTEFEAKPGELSFIELGVADPERARSFFGELLGWSFPPYGETGSMVAGAGIGAGLHGDDPGGGVYAFFAVHDLDQAIERLEELGGELAQSVGDDDPAYGRFVLCRDDQGTPFGLHEPPSG